MTEIINDEKINIHSLTKKLRVTDIKQFDAYLKDIWVDLFSRVTENKNDKDKSVKLNGLSKVVFNSYYNLPGLIGDRLFKVFDTNCNNSIELIEFVEGMRTLFYEDYEKNSRFIFDFYDFDNDGKISQEDIRVVLSYITLTYMEPNNSEKKIIDGINISYKNRLTSQEELCDILSNCFNDSHIKTSIINYKQFKYIIENINSDIYLMIFLFLLERKPFTNKNIKSYEHHSRNSSKNSSNSSKGKRKRLLASPTKHANFSPYRRFHNKNSSINLQKQNSINLHTHMGESQSDFSMSPILKKMPKKKNSYNFSHDKIIHLRQTLESKEIIYSGFKKKDELKEEKNTDGINEERINELTSRKKRNNENIREDSPLKPAFKQTKKKIINKKEKDSDNENDYNIEFIDNDDEGNSSSDSSYDNHEYSEIENEGLTYQGKLYKYVKDKMKELWFKLIYKDLYYYKNKNEKIHRGMHNLS